MHKNLIPAGAAVVLALLLVGCETDSVSTRTQEKSAVYANLKPWQKKNIDKGSIAQGFTPDMVYIVMGRPDKVEAKEFREGKAELWIYGRYYPKAEALHRLKPANFTLESAYQSQRAASPASSGGYASRPTSVIVPLATEGTRGQITGKPGGVQGGSMEPADLRSYTFKVLFAGDSVVKFGADLNAN